jgi:hypothetical protein
MALKYIDIQQRRNEANPFLVACAVWISGKLLKFLSEENGDPLVEGNNNNDSSNTPM